MGEGGRPYSATACLFVQCFVHNVGYRAGEGFPIVAYTTARAQGRPYTAGGNVVAASVNERTIPISTAAVTAVHT